MLFDSHCHLNDERLYPQADEIVLSFGKDGLEGAITVGYDRKSSELALSLAQKYQNVWAAVGTHPHDSKTLTADDLEYYRQISADKKVVAIGEIGLDYFYDLSPRDAQKAAVEAQLELANFVGLPVIFHLRDAYCDMLELLKKNKDKLKNGCLLHCYSGSAEMIAEFLRLGDFYFAYGGGLTFKNARVAIESIKKTPMDKLLLETDCPYLTPTPFRGQTNFPKYISYTADKAAEILEIDRKVLEETTTNNLKTLFKKIV